MRRIAGLLVTVVVGAAAAPAVGAESLGYSTAGVSPIAVSAPGDATFAFTVTAPPGGASSTFVLHGGPTPETLPALPKNVADDGTGGTAVPTLDVKGARLDGPGTLGGLARTMELNERAACVRDGVLSWGSDLSYRLNLPAGQTTRILVDVTVPAGLAARSAGLQLTPFAWQPIAPAIDDLAAPAGAAGDPLLSEISRAPGGADQVSLKSTKLANGLVKLTGTIRPVRQGQRIQIVGRPVKKKEQASPYFLLSTALGSTGKSQRVLAEARTNAAGNWHVNLKLDTRTALVARTTKGNAPLTTRGASCPLVLKP
jgi:hypothetical protein